MVAFSIGNISIYWYGIFYFITFVLGYLFLRWIGKKGFFKKHAGVQRLLTTGLDDLILATVIGVIIGGRLGHVFLYDRTYFSQNLGEIFAIRHGGMSFIGGIVGVVIAIFIVEKLFKLTRKDLFIIFDLLLVIVPIGIILGRWGNFLNQELYGIAVPDSLSALRNTRLTHVYPNVDNQVRFNTNLLAALFEGVLIWVIILYQFVRQYIKKQRRPGRITVIFIMLYSIVRFFLEFFRQDSQTEYVGIFTTTQWIMILFLGFGLVLRLFAGETEKKNRLT